SKMRPNTGTGYRFSLYYLHEIRKQSMPAEIDAATRADIAFYAAQGYSQEGIAEETGVSRRTVRKYLDLTREEVAASDRPRETLCAIVRGEYDWQRGDLTADEGGYMSM
ncbi:hypothetical protein BRC78_01050, partial [Halobacteriales archaeon QH_8_68_33]